MCIIIINFQLLSILYINKCVQTLFCFIESSDQSIYFVSIWCQPASLSPLINLRIPYFLLELQFPESWGNCRQLSVPMNDTGDLLISIWKSCRWWFCVCWGRVLSLEVLGGLRSVGVNSGERPPLQCHRLWCQVPYKSG